MTSVLLRALLVALLLAVAGVALARRAGARVRSADAAGGRASGRWPLEPRRTLLSAPERVLYRRLLRALPGGHVLCQVQLLQMLQFEAGGRSAELINRISRLSIDFLVIDDDTRVLAAIELDDPSHERAERRAADARKTRALASAGIPLLRWRVAHMPDEHAIAAILASVTGRRIESAAIGPERSRSRFV